MGKITKKSTPKKDKVTLDEESKRNLANLVKEREALWKISHKDYKKPEVSVNHWREIATELEISVTECKKQWKSLKDALRYRQTGRKTKSGDPAPEETVDDTFNVISEALNTWEFWEDLQFLVENKPQRSTLSSDLSGIQEDELSNVDSAEKDDVALADNNVESSTSADKRKGESNYDYMNQAKKKPKVTLDDSTEKLVDGIHDLIELRKSSHQLKKPELKFQSIYENLDRMLCQLPTELVEDLNMQFVQLTYDAVKRQRDILF